MPNFLEEYVDFIGDTLSLAHLNANRSCSGSAGRCVLCAVANELDVARQPTFKQEIRRLLYMFARSVINAVRAKFHNWCPVPMKEHKKRIPSVFHYQTARQRGLITLPLSECQEVSSTLLVGLYRWNANLKPNFGHVEARELSQSRIHYCISKH